VRRLGQPDPAASAYDDEFHFSGTMRQVVVELGD
jgi:hypothetical protein